MLGDDHDDAAQGPAPERRWDPAHTLRPRGSVPAPEPVAASARTHARHAAPSRAANDAFDGDAGLGRDSGIDDVDFIAASPVMLAEHAASLASRLQQRLEEVDRRESRLNSQEAEFDTRIRNARLWVEQCEADITRRTQQLDELDQQLAQRQELAADQLEQAEELHQRLVELGEREKAAEAVRIELELGRTEMHTKLDALDLETAACRTRQLQLDEAKQKFEQRQRDLDRREAQLYTEREQVSRQQAAHSAALADLERRTTLIAAREASLNELQERLSQTASENEFRHAELESASAALERQAAEAASSERRLQFRQREIDAALRRFERLGVVEEKMVELEQQAAAFEMRGAYLDNAEAMLAERQMVLAEQAEQLQRDQLAFENQVSRERRTLASAAEQAEAQGAARTNDLNRREQALDLREKSLEQLAEELRTSQRESLETRLATEETWQQLQGALAPAALARSIALCRGRLTEHYQLAADDLQRRRTDLDRIRGALADQLAEVDQRRLELQAWLRQQQSQIEQQAARLVAREQTLEEQDAEFRKHERRWQAERVEYLDQIQSLLAQLRARDPVAADRLSAAA